MKLQSKDRTLEGTRIEKYYDALLLAFEKAEYNLRPGPLLEQWFKDAGFINIIMKPYHVPIKT
jgi:hypothetical protein